jgi:hypothetical protein
MKIEHRLLTLERSIGVVQTDEPPQPLHDDTYYFRWGVVRFTGPGRVRNISLFDPVGDIALATAHIAWELRQRPAVWILLTTDENERGIAALEAGSYYRGDYLTGLDLQRAVNTAVQAWTDQGEEIPAGGDLELLQYWRTIE